MQRPSLSMANTAQRLSGLNLNAIEVKALTRWPDAMVEDYLSFLRNLLELAAAIDEGEEGGEDVATEILNDPVLPEKYKPDTVVISQDYETAGDQKIICTNGSPITVTLSNTPEDLEELTVQRARKKVTLDGNGININGQAKIVLDAQYVSLTLIYVAEINERVII